MSVSAPATAPEVAPAPEAGSPRDDSDLILSRWGVRVAVVLAVAPLVVAAVNLSVRYGNAYQPIGDLAQVEQLTRDVGRHPVLTGPYSRDGWHHPGPALYYLTAPPYRLLGSTSTAMNVAALAVNAAAVAGIAAVARRRGGHPLMLVSLLGCALLMRSLGPDELRLPWNPYVTVLPYLLLVFLTWSLTRGDRWMLPVAVGVASFVAQTHIGYMALALPLLAVGALWLVARTARRARRDAADAVPLRRLWAPVLVSAVVGAVMWFPPLYQQVTRSPGNLASALRWFGRKGSEGEATHGLVDGWRIVSAQLGAPPEWLFGARGVSFLHDPVYLYDPMLPVLLVPVALAALVLTSGRRRVAGGRELVGLWVLASAVGVVATARTIGPVYEYRLGWSQALGMVAGLIVGWAGWLVLARWRPQLERRLLVPLALVGLAVLAAVGSAAQVQAGEPQVNHSAQVRELMPGVLDGLPGGDGPVRVDTDLSFYGATYAAAIVLQLERHGIDAVLRPGDTAMGEHRGRRGVELRAHLRVATGATIALVGTQPGATGLAQAEEVRPGAQGPGREEAGRGAPAPPVAVFLIDTAAAGEQPAGAEGAT